MKKFSLSLYFLIITFVVAAQQERTVLLYNLGFGGITAGIGAAINTPKEKNKKKAFLRGFWQGAIGGSLSYSGKKMVFKIRKTGKLWYGWPSKILHAAGTSIIENAALTEPFLQNWNIDYGPLRIDFSVNGKKDFKVRLLPQSIYSIIMCSRHASLNIKTSLATGNIAFLSDTSFVYRIPGNAGGVSFGRSFVYAGKDYPYYATPHELIHIYQYREHQVFNSWLKPFENKIRSKTIHRLIDKYIYPDIPYFAIFYGLQYNKLQNHYKNFYEFEAERFATNAYVPR